MEATKWKAEKDIEQSNRFLTLEVEEGLKTRKEENEEERQNKKMEIKPTTQRFV